MKRFNQNTLIGQLKDRLQLIFRIRTSGDFSFHTWHNRAVKDAKIRFLTNSVIVDADFLPKLLINILTSILMSAICIGLIGQFSFHTSMPIAHSPLYKNNQIEFFLVNHLYQWTLYIRIQ